MIFRFGAFLLLLYAIGFVLYAVTLARPANGAARTDAIVVITGGKGRIEHAMEVLGEGRAKRMLVSGTDPSVTKRDLVNRLGGRERLVRCCVDLGSESVDTRSQNQFKSLRLITSDWHMRRARYEFRKVLGGEYEMITDAVRTEPHFTTLFSEYNKYVLRRISVWFDM